MSYSQCFSTPGMSDRIRLSNISYSSGSRTLLDRVGLTVPDGQTFVVTGRSGCGKSTLLEIAAGLITPRAGEVFWDGVRLGDMSRESLVEARIRMGFVFQQHALISNMPVFENIALPVRYHLGLTDREVQDMVAYQMERLHISDLSDMLPEQISAGQARLAAIGRALVMAPDLLFLDEPVAGLDAVATQVVVEILEEIRNTSGMTMLIVSHVVSLILRMKSPVALLDNGTVSFHQVDVGAADGAEPAFISHLTRSDLET